jgi:hydrogenase maturation factor HypF (carbamoyltransferase family)
LTPSSSARILRTLSRKNAFYFFTSVGNYTGQSAMSLEEFANKIREDETTSLEFHLYREDFEKWTAEVLEDSELTEKISDLKNLEPVRSALRDQLYLIVSKRLEELKTLNS